MGGGKRRGADFFEEVSLLDDLFIYLIKDFYIGQKSFKDFKFCVFDKREKTKRQFWVGKEI